MLSIDNYWMKYALKQAYLGKKNGEVPIGSLLIKNNNLISSAWNSCINLFDASAHAEILVIRNGGKILKNYRLKNTILYVTHEPCFMCSEAIINARINKVVYGSYSFKKNCFSYYINFLYINNIKHHIKEIKSGILLYECSNLLKNFFRRKRYT
ncbi:tRNA adenosine(34) deaminase TadA [Buchnera aphidicola]|uniref:tRNA-specific adenosine deaminase n=1 Tax=Buchnera aphidicola subsp. Cinara cedri (strain Cc) TaxID=372461 RepID=Q057R7_BUCCC|nr:tRNA adenosine(34) deaminase TadA [Buchnera aphidicola]ABJ90632.1 tRNA-specific adenosine deaminase [Buchnera aphidicola BCc]